MRILPFKDFNRHKQIFFSCRNGRKKYYNSKLVASAVRLTEEMTEEDVRDVIKSRFHLFVGEEFPEFEFISAVDDDLVKPSVPSWNFRTIKHIYRTGPVYLRCKKKYDIFIEEQHDNEECVYSDDSWDDKLLQPALHIKSNDTMRESVNLLSSSSTCSINPTKAKPLLNCPLCYKDFPSNEIEHHASSCSTPTTIIDDPYSISSDEDDNDRTIPFMESQLDSTKTLEEVIKPIQLYGIEKFKIRRGKAWLDFCQTLEKPWVTGKKKFSITFVGEAGIDDGGLSREFFSGIFDYFHFCIQIIV